MRIWDAIHCSRFGGADGELGRYKLFQFDLQLRSATLIFGTRVDNEVNVKFWSETLDRIHIINC